MPTPTVTPVPGLAQRLKRGLKTVALRCVAASPLPALAARRYGGRGVILMFHDVVVEPDDRLGQGCRIADLERILRGLRAGGRDIVTLDEALARLAAPTARPFAVLTFDDGYRSNRDLALPLLERYEAPATIYVPTGAATRELYAWWLGLTELFLRHDTVDLMPMGVRFHCPDRETKAAALQRTVAWVWEDFRRADLLRDVFTRHDVAVADAVAANLLDAAALAELDRHPLVEIAAHTTTHRALALVADGELAEDIAANKLWLEELLGREVPHFAYPYGPPSISGLREVQAVRAAGFRSAVTTTAGCLFPEHLAEPFLLPRQNAEYAPDSASYAACGASGLVRAIITRGGPPAMRPAEAMG